MQRTSYPLTHDGCSLGSQRLRNWLIDCSEMMDHERASIDEPCWSARVYVDLSIDQRSRNICILRFCYQVMGDQCRRRVEGIEIEAAIE